MTAKPKKTKLSKPQLEIIVTLAYVDILKGISASVPGMETFYQFYTNMHFTQHQHDIVARYEEEHQYLAEHFAIAMETDE